MAGYDDMPDANEWSAARSNADNTHAGYDRVDGSTREGGYRERVNMGGASERGAYQPRQGQGQGYPQGRPQGYPQGQGYPRQGYPQGGYPQGQHGYPRQGGYPQGRPQGYPQGRPQGYPQGQNGYPRQGGYPQGYPQGQGQGYPPRGVRPQGQGQGYPQGQGAQGYNRNNQAYRGAGAAGAAAAGARMGNAQGASRNQAAGVQAARNQAARGRGAATNVQFVDSSGRSRYDRTANAGSYRKEYGTTRPKVFRIVLLVILALVLAGLIFGIVKIVGLISNVYTNDRLDKEQQEQLESMLAEGKATEPFYMVLLGTDSSAWRESIGYDNQLSDSMILVRVDPPNGKLTLISLLRDTWINTTEWSEEVWDLVDSKYLPYITSEIKLNSANTYGGPALLVACVTQLTGLPISHYAEIDMDGFIGLVDAVGGIEVNIPIDLYDEMLDVSFSAGWQTLTGEQALDLCRMRHAYEQGNTEYGHGGDVYRAANQRMVISALLKKILASDASTLMKSVTELTKYVSVDKGLSVTDVVSLAMAFRGLDSSTDIYSTRIPTVGGYLNEGQWQVMVSRMNQGLSPVTEDVIDPASGTILQSAGTGDITDLATIDSQYPDQTATEGEGDTAADAA